MRVHTHLCQMKQNLPIWDVFAALIPFPRRTALKADFLSNFRCGQAELAANGAKSFLNSHSNGSLSELWTVTGSRHTQPQNAATD